MGLLHDHINEALRLKDVRPSTRDTYLRALSPFLMLEMETLGVPQLNGILLGIANQNTRRKTVIALKSCVDHPAVNALKLPESVPRLYELPDETTLRLALLTCPHETRALLMMYAGLRIGEACGIVGSDVKGRWLSVERQVDGYTRQIIPVKTDTDRVPLPEWLVPKVQDLQAIQVSPKAVRKALLNAGRRVGIHLNPHQLRTWYCNHLIEKGLPPHVVQRLMRHKSIRVTFTHYAQAADRDLIRAVSKLGEL